MNFTNLSRLVDDLVQKQGGYRGPTSTTDSAEYLDWAMKVLAQRCAFFDPKVSFALVADQETYRLDNLSTFSKYVLDPLSVYIGGNPLYDASGRRAGLWTINELNQFNPQWRTQSHGTPYVAVAYGSNTLLLNPKPDSTTVSAGNCFVEGTVVPGWWKTDGTYSASGAAGVVADGTATPDLPADMHEVLAVLAAVKAIKPMADSDAGWALVNAYSTELADSVETLARRNRAAMSALGSILPSDRAQRFVRLDGSLRRW
ncbi:MAG: hypothetical protein JST93_14495 [Acidobacteria bacterium]|nr:hypothetical protein [Acidobacteriota bacterium]